MLRIISNWKCKCFHYYLSLINILIHLKNEELIWWKFNLVKIYFKLKNVFRKEELAKLNGYIIKINEIIQNDFLLKKIIKIFLFDILILNI